MALSLVTLDNFKLGPQFIQIVKVLYAKPFAMVYTGNTCSSLFPILRGTCQGYPLAPLLLTLSLEPLAQKIRQHPSVLSISVKGIEHCILLYADNILLYTGDTGFSLTHLLSIFDLFGSLFGYKINWSKSSLLHLNLVARTLSLPSGIPVVSHFRYLGIDISPFIFHIASHNFQSQFNLIDKDLQIKSSF